MSAYLTQPLKRAAQVNANGIATIDGTRRRTWANVRDRVARAAGALRSLGIEDGDRVAVLASGSDTYFELHFALPWAGAAMVLLNTRLAPAELAHIVKDSGAVALLYDDSQKATVKALAEVTKGMRAVVPLTKRYEQMIDSAEPIADRMRGGDEMAGIFYTGGSSGLPKGVVLTYNNLSTNAMNAYAGVGYAHDSIYLHAAPMFHLTDGMSTYSLTMAAGTHVFMPSFKDRLCLDLIQKHGVTNICIVPTMVEMLVNLAEKEAFDASSLRQIQFGAAPMPDATLARAIALWPDLKFLHGWGMTEISPLGTLLPAEWRDPRAAGERMKSCGQPVLNEEIIIADALDNEVPRGEVGEILVRGPMVMKEYWNMPEATAEALRGGWMHTGDAAYMDKDGFIFIVDRIKDMIITGGENVFSLEVENALGAHPGVAQVAVIAVPDAHWGERVHAVIVPKHDVPEETELVAFCRERIAAYKSPRSMEIRKALPLTGAGKISKKTLRDEFIARNQAEAES
jgi:long-chain acyl-CoA synthetase